MRLLYFSLAMLACFALNGLSPRFAAAEVIIQFDYSLDTQGFFNDPVRRERLEQAAALWRFTDALAPILPGDGNAWSIRLQHPGEPSFPTRNNLSVPANTVLIYPGGRPLVGALGFANAATLLSRSGSPEFLAAVDNRGQTGATQTPPVDFGPTVGTITFSSSAPWHFGATTEGLDSTKQDFLTTAVHEIGHLLGIGESASWDALMRSTPGGLVFDGAASTAAHGGPVPVDPFGSHPASGHRHAARRRLDAGARTERLRDCRSDGFRCYWHKDVETSSRPIRRSGQAGKDSGMSLELIRADLTFRQLPIRETS
jgi:hypothetical protein